MPEDDGVREFAITYISETTPTIICEDNKRSVEIKINEIEEPFEEDLDKFVQDSSIFNSDGRVSLKYQRSNGSLIFILNEQSQVSDFLESVITMEERDNILSETEIEAKNKAIQLEDATKTVKDWSKDKFTDITWERNRLKMNGRQINLNGFTIINALNKVQIVGEKVRIPYKNSNGKESIYYLSLEKTKEIIELSDEPNLKKSLDKINILSKKNITTMEFEKPEINGNFIQSKDYEAPKIILEEMEQIHKSITKKDGSYFVSIYINGSGKPYKLVFTLQDYNELLQKTA